MHNVMQMKVWSLAPRAAFFKLSMRSRANVQGILGLSLRAKAD